MNQIKKLGIVFLVLLTFSSFSCDICGSYMGITPYNSKNAISFLHRYRIFNGYKNYQTHSNFFPISAYKTAHELPADSNNMVNNYSSKDFESYKIFELRLKYFIFKRVEANIFLPVLNNKSKNNDVFVSNTGLGDVSILMGYHIIKPNVDAKTKHKLVFGLGIKLPTGNHFAHDTYSNRLPFEMQAGTGSYDMLLNLNYLLMRKKVGVNLNCSFKQNGTNNYKEQLATSTTNFISFFYNISIKKIVLYPSVQCNYEYSKGLFVSNKSVMGTEVNSFLLGPGLDLYYKNFSLNTAWQFTTYENVDAGLLKSAGRLSFGLTYSFNGFSKKK